MSGQYRSSRVPHGSLQQLAPFGVDAAKRWIMGLALVHLVLVLSTLAQEPDLLELEDTAITQAVSQVASSVVRIETLGGTELVENRLIGGGPTTGLIIDAEGWILSSAFGFANRPASILVDLPSGTRKPAKIVARDETRRLVLLKVEPDQPLPVPEFISPAELQLGQRTIALGRTYSPEKPNVSVGILSALHRIFGRAVQTDAKVSPSNYGGPLVTLDGRVIGLLVPLSPDHGQESSALAGSEWYDSGVGFAVPLDSVFRRISDLQKGSNLLPGRLGVIMEPGYRFALAPKVKRIIPETPSAKAGLKPGDTLTHVNQTAVTTLAEFHDAMGEYYAGDKVQLTFMRGEQSTVTDVILAGPVPPVSQAYLGILPGSASQEGVEIRYVFPNTPASTLGLQPGDWITHLNDQPVGQATELRNGLEGFFPHESLAIRYRRGEQVVDGTFEVAERSSVIAADVPLRMPTPPTPPAKAEAAQVAEVKQEEPAPRGVVPIQLPEQEFVCQAYLPKRWSAQDPLSLLVILSPPGIVKPEEALSAWQDRCEEFGIAALLPHASREDRWLPAEGERILNAIQVLTRRQAINAHRLAFFGQEGGGSMAMLVAFRGIKLVRGVAVIDAAPPVSVDLPANEPGKRMSIWIAKREGSGINPRIDAVLEQLEKKRFPVHRSETTSAQLNAEQQLSIARWLDQLDQL